TSASCSGTTRAPISCGGARTATARTASRRPIAAPSTRSARRCAAPTTAAKTRASGATSPAAFPPTARMYADSSFATGSATALARLDKDAGRAHAARQEPIAHEQRLVVVGVHGAAADDEGGAGAARRQRRFEADRRARMEPAAPAEVGAVAGHDHERHRRAQL